MSFPGSSVSDELTHTSFCPLEANLNNDRAVQSNGFISQSITLPRNERTENTNLTRHVLENGKGQESEKEKPVLFKDYLKHRGMQTALAP